MKQYLKMGEHFSGVVNVDNDGNVSDDKFHRGSLGDFDEKYFEVIAHAINSHDELVQMNQDLLNALESIENDAGQVPKFMWDMIQATIAKAKGGAA